MAKCGRCGSAAGFQIEAAEVPISGKRGQVREIQFVRCGMVDCLAVVGVLPHDADIRDQLRQAHEKLDALGRILRAGS